MGLEPLTLTHTVLPWVFILMIRIDPEAAKAKWLEISEAYDVLSDEKKKGLYDQFGEVFESNAVLSPPFHVILFKDAMHPPTHRSFLLYNNLRLG